MPKRTDLKSILIIGSGPIIIGQACEFDYSGTQAIKALKEEGYRVLLVNSNPATIMTDPELADETFIEPITAETVEKIIAQTRPCALLPTMGGQTALNCALELAEKGVFEKYNCELIGASIEAIKTAEDRELFRRAMDEIGLKSAPSVLARTVEEALEAAKVIGFPTVLRPSRTLGGSGGGIAYDVQDLKKKAAYALHLSPNHECLIEKSLVGWKEMELEVMRDKKDNVVIVCGIENFDPMGVHTGDSITVAPIQTLTDKEYQCLRNAALAVMRKIGVDTGGSNVQFAMNPENGDIVVIEMNPRVSRSSALASKATGFPIAKIAAKVAVGYSLDEIPNDITEKTPACFEPSIDYVVVKIPRFNFEKFPFADSTLGTQMKSVGEAMAFGRTFREALQKACTSLELGSYGLDRENLFSDLGRAEVLEGCKRPSPERLWFLAEALRRDVPIQEVFSNSFVDPWFLSQLQRIISAEKDIKTLGIENVPLLELKRAGFTDRRLSVLSGKTEDEIFAMRQSAGAVPHYKKVDTCAAEFEAATPYLYSTYDAGDEALPSKKKKVIILGSGPNRIGQGIEFDYCCVHAVMALRDDGFETIMVNCNPETVSTDYDTSDRLYFEPLTFEHVRQVVEREREGLVGIMVQLGGQTPLKLAASLESHGFPIIGTSVDSIDIAEDRERFSALVEKLGLKQAPSANIRSLAEGKAAAVKLGFPLMLRPSFVLGGRAMRIVYSMQEVEEYLTESVQASENRPVLMDRFLESAIEIDVDAVSDGSEVLIAGVMEHIELAGIHSGDSSCSLPPQSLSQETIQILESQTIALAKALKVCGVLNVQYAVTKDGQVYVIEANPRASRTVPFVSKATGIPWAKVAARVMVGQTLAKQGIHSSPRPDYVSVKACVFPFNKFPGVDTVLGPEMKSTGEVMGIASDFAGAFAKSQLAAKVTLPTAGAAFISVSDGDKAEAVQIAAHLATLGFALIATEGTAKALYAAGIRSTVINKVRDGSPHIVDLLGEGKVQLVINTPEGPGTHLDSKSIRLVANELLVPTYTTTAAGKAAVRAIERLQKKEPLGVQSIQKYHEQLRQTAKAA